MSFFQVESLSTSQSGAPSLKDIALNVSAGEIVGILGPKGAGKRRLLEVMSGNCRPEKGTFRIADRDATKLSAAKRAQLGVVSSLVAPSVWTNLVDAVRVPTVAQYVSRSLRRMGRISRAESAKRITEVLDRFALNNVADRRLDALSAGERSRVQWAALLVCRPKLMIVDEPFRGAEFLAESAALLCREIARQGVAVVLSQRDLRGIDLYDRVYVLDQGEAIAQGAPHEVTRRLDVLKLFAGERNGSSGEQSPWRDTTRPAATDGRRSIFISYTRQDVAWMERLESKLAPLVEPCGWKIWTDRQIAPGSDWFGEIHRAMTMSSAAILLVSPEYLNSSFVSQHELPTLTAAAGAGRLQLLWLPLRPSEYVSRELGAFQALLDPRRPLASEHHAASEHALEIVCNRIFECLNRVEKMQLPKAS